MDLRRLARHLAVLLSAVVAVTSIVFIRHHMKGGDRLAVDCASQDVGTVRPNESRTVRYVFHNSGWTSVRLIGAEQLCGSDGCNEVEGLPLKVRPGSRVTMEVEFRAPGVARSFCKRFPVYTDRVSQPRVDLEIRGTVRGEREGSG